MKSEAVDELYKATLLHDMVKIGILDAVLLKQSRLTDEEFELIKQHTVIGSSILSNMSRKNRYCMQCKPLAEWNRLSRWAKK